LHPIKVWSNLADPVYLHTIRLNQLARRRLMRIVLFATVVGSLLLFTKPSLTPALTPEATNVNKVTPLILEKDEGERRVVRGWPGHPAPGETFILKVDPQNGGSSHLVFLTAEIGPGGEIPAHKHPGADEILFLQTGTARVHLGDAVREVHSGATIFIPANTWIAVSNVGSDAIRMECVFSAPGFEEFMREGSVREGEKNVPMTEAEDAASQKRHSHDVIYKQP
jgi:quercetin dioxygenase-like cupin family protein